MGPADAQALLTVDVVFAAAPHAVDLTTLQLPPGATVAEALQASGLLRRRGLVLDALDVGVWGRACSLQLALRDRDRVEVYRPLRVDPKEARRQRYKGKARGLSGSPTR